MKNKILDDFNMDTNFKEFGMFLAKSGIFGGKPMRNEKAPNIQNLNDGFTLVAIDTIKDNNLKI